MIIIQHTTPFRVRYRKHMLIVQRSILMIVGLWSFICHQNLTYEKLIFFKFIRDI